VAAVAEASPLAGRTAHWGDDGPHFPIRGAGRAVGGTRGRAPVERDERGDGKRRSARSGVGVGVLLSPVIGRDGRHLPLPGRHGIERRVREASEILVRVSQVRSTQIHVSARRAYNVPTRTLWSAMEVPLGFSARMSRLVADFG